jgi:hypothetical protein
VFIKSDIYAIGAIFLKMIVGNFNFSERTPEHIKQFDSCLNKNGKPLSYKVIDFLKGTL